MTGQPEPVSYFYFLLIEDRNKELAFCLGGILISKIISCIDDGLKELLIEALKKKNALTNEIQEFLNNIPACPLGVYIDLAETSGKKRTKRALSEYNKFISTCMREARIRETGKKASSVMKECALKWKEKK